MKFDTLVIHGGIDGDQYTGAVTVPIYQTSTFSQDGIGKHGKYEYARTGNPTREALEKLIADLEGGSKGFAFSSGMAAISSVLMLFKSGDHIILSEDVYGGTFRVMENVFSNLGIQHSFINVKEIDKVEESIKESTKAIYIETPSNPLMKVIDISSIAEIANKNGLLLIVDNTFMSPYLQKPLDLGADIVIHSGTKYLGGHSDLIAGLVAVNSEDIAYRIQYIQNAVGAILGPQDSWLLIKGIKTLSLRMERHCQNTKKIYDWLSKQNWVENIYHPSQWINYKIRNQMKDYGGMISFEVNSKGTMERLIDNLKIIILGESLGGVESIISIPSIMSHGSMPKDKRETLGIKDTLLRLSVGIEDVEDIINDLDINNK